jgi:hypothetical protein
MLTEGDCSDFSEAGETGTESPICIRIWLILNSEKEFRKRQSVGDYKR